MHTFEFLGAKVVKGMGCRTHVEGFVSDKTCANTFG